MEGADNGSSIQHPQCAVPLDLPSWAPPLIGLGIFVNFLASFGIAYAVKEHERTKNYYGRVDAASRRTESARENRSGGAVSEVQRRLLDKDGEMTAVEASAMVPSDTDAEDDRAAEDELHGRNPNKVSVICEQSPSHQSVGGGHHSTGIKVMMKKRKSVAQRSVVGSSLPKSSAAVDALSLFAPRILFDSTSRGIEIMDIVTKGVGLVTEPSEAALRETIVAAIKTKLDEIRERRHIIFAIPDKNGEPIVRGASCIVGMMRQTLVLSVGFEMPAMRVYCYELDVGDAAPSLLAPGKSGSGSGNRSHTAVDRAKQHSVGSAEATAKAVIVAAKSPAPKAQIVPAKTQPGSSGKSEKKPQPTAKGVADQTQMTQQTAPARSPNMPSSTCPSTCTKTKKSAATPAATPKKQSNARKPTVRKNSNYSRLRTARTPGAQTPQRTQRTVTAIEESLYSVASAEKKKSKTSTKSVVKSDQKLYPV